MSTTEPMLGSPGWKCRSWLSLSLALATLVVALVLAGRSGKTQHSGAVHGPSLAAYLPHSLDGRLARDFPVAESASVQQVVDSLLNYSDAVVRVYSLDGVDVQVYVAYWEAGRMPALQLAVHNPDQCWIGGGWKVVESGPAQIQQLGGHDVQPGERRIFRDGRGSTMHVAYWLLAGDEVFGYVKKSGLLSSLGERVGLMFHSICSGTSRVPIYFVRVSSAEPIERVLARPASEPLLKALVGLPLKRTVDRVGTR